MIDAPADAVDLVLAIANAGVIMWAEGDKVRWRGAGQLPSEVREEVMRRRDEIHDVLDVPALERQLGEDVDRLLALEAAGEMSEEYRERGARYLRRLRLYRCVATWHEEAAP